MALRESAMVSLLKYNWRDVRLFRDAMTHIKAVHDVLDIGPGIRPQSLVPCNEQICVEPHGEYADALRESGYRVIQAPAPGAFTLFDDCVDTVVLLDVIEHMDKGDGRETIRQSCERARQQVVIFTPFGFMKQSGGDKSDAWGMNGQRWQEHRSGWVPSEFIGWKIFADSRFAEGHAAFMAIWDHP